MARILVVFHRAPLGQWRSTYDSHVNSFKAIPGHEVFYLNSAWLRVPSYVKSLDPDLVIFHYTFLAHRVYPPTWYENLERVRFVSQWDCRKALVPHDEQVHADVLCAVCRDFGVTHVFTPAAESEWRKIYREVDFDHTEFRTVLTGYLDPVTVRKYARRAADLDRPIDVGYRSWSVQPSYGRHGLLKLEVGRAFAQAAPAFGLQTDISSDYRDAFLGESWFEFLLRCKYTIGVEGGTSVLDYDGSLAECSVAYGQQHPGASFEEVEAACFPGRDGEFDYFLLGPRHLEAVLTKTCQALVEGSYGGTMEAGVHYIPVKKDFSNLDEVVAIMKDDRVRAEMVDRAYRDVVESGEWTFEAFARGVLDECLAGADLPERESGLRTRWLLLRNRIDCIRWWERLRPLLHPKTFARTVYVYARELAVRLIGKERLWKLLIALHNASRRVQGKPPLDLEVGSRDVQRQESEAE